VLTSNGDNTFDVEMSLLVTSPGVALDDVHRNIAARRLSAHDQRTTIE
jgi:hypothetical protein